VSVAAIHPPVARPCSPAAPKRDPRAAARWGRALLVVILAAWGAGAVVGFERALAGLTILGFALAIFGFRNRILGLYGVSILCTLDPVTRQILLMGGVLRWNTFNYLLLLVILVSAMPLLRWKNGPTRLLIAFAALLVVEIAWGGDWKEGAQHVLSAVAYFGLVVYFARAGRDPRIWTWLGLVNGTLAAAGGLIFFAQGTFVSLVNPNAFVYFPLTAMFSICLGARGAGRVVRLVLAGLAIANFAWVFLSGSRGGLLIALLCLFFLSVRLLGGPLGWAFVATALFLGVLLSARFGERESYTLHRIGKFLDPSESMAERTSGRYDLVVAGWNMFLDHPLFGVGTGGFAGSWARLEGVEGLSNYGVGREVQAHAGWMKTLAENGLPGLVMHAAFVLSFAVLGWRRRAQGLLFPGLLATGALAVAFISTEFQTKGIWFLAAGVAVLLQSPQLLRRPEPSRG
jgi:O-antigen ligase